MSKPSAEWRDVLLGGLGLELWIGKQKEHVALLIAEREIHLDWVKQTAATAAAC
jgi:hypothetical protein